MFNRMKLVLDGEWVCYWLLPSNNSVVYQDSDNNTQTFEYETYQSAAWNFIVKVTEAQILGFTHVPS